MKKRNYVALQRKNLIRVPTRGKWEYDKDSATDTELQTASVIIVSGAWCAALKRHLESFMLHQQLSWANYLLNYWLKFRNPITYSYTDQKLCFMVIQSGRRRCSWSVSTLLLIHMFSGANSVPASLRCLPPSLLQLFAYSYSASKQKQPLQTP